MLVLHKGRNTRNQATQTCRRAMLQSKPKHPNPGKADASLKRGTISICPGHQEELSNTCVARDQHQKASLERRCSRNINRAAQRCQAACMFSF